MADYLIILSSLVAPILSGISYYGFRTGLIAGPLSAFPPLPTFLLHFSLTVNTPVTSVATPKKIATLNISLSANVRLSEPPPDCTSTEVPSTSRVGSVPPISPTIQPRPGLFTRFDIPSAGSVLTRNTSMNSRCDSRPCITPAVTAMGPPGEEAEMGGRPFSSSSSSPLWFGFRLLLLSGSSVSGTRIQAPPDRDTSWAGWPRSSIQKSRAERGVDHAAAARWTTGRAGLAKLGRMVCAVCVCVCVSWSGLLVDL